MVYTVTLNPALDYIMQVKKLRFDDINRSYFEDLHYGGKGINVSVVLKRLGIANKAMGFIAGFTGDHLEEMLISEGIDCDFLRLEKGDTRINVKIKSETELDINARGPQIEPEDIENLISGLNKIQPGDYLVLAGSIPENLPDDIYERMLSELDGRGVNFVVDTTGDLLLRVLKYKPFLIKPNHHELGDLFGVKVQSDEDVVLYAKKLQELGAKNVLVSRGSKGATLLDENGKVTNIGIIEGKIVSTVGSGDSMVAGFIAGYSDTGDFSHALRLGAACGNATAFCNTLAEASGIQSAYKKLKTNEQEAKK